MNQYYLRFMAERDGRVYRVPVLVSLLALPVLMLSLFGWQLYRAIDQLYVWKVTAGLAKRVLAGKLAAPVDALMNESGMLFCFLAVVLFLSVGLLIPVFLADTRNGRNIDTLMRLPYSRLHYYGVRLALPAAAGLLIWLETLGTAFLCRTLYLQLVPAECLPAAAAEAFWQSALCQTWFSFGNPGQLAAALSVLLLFPATMILTIFADRGRSLLCILGRLPGIGALLYFFYSLPLAGLILPAVTAAVILCGCYAVCRKKTF